MFPVVVLNKVDAIMLSMTQSVSNFRASRLSAFTCE